MVRNILENVDTLDSDESIEPSIPNGVVENLCILLVIQWVVVRVLSLSLLFFFHSNIFSYDVLLQKPHFVNIIFVRYGTISSTSSGS